MQRAGTLLILGLALFPVVGDRQAGADPPAAPRQTEPADATGPTAAWHPSLDRSRQLEQRFEIARRDLAQERYHDAIARLQSILDDPTDVFVSTPGSSPQGARRLAATLLGTLPPEARRLYATLYDGQAEQLLTAATKAHDLRGLEQVVQQFFHTPSGGQACLRLAQAWTDRGCWSRAASFWERLRTDPVHSRTLGRNQVLRAELCARLAGRTTERPLAPGDQAWLADHSRRMSRSRADTVSGPSARSGTADSATVPLATRPLWQAPLAGDAMPHIAPILAAWEAYQLSHAQSIITANFALPLGHLLVVRDLEGVRALDTRTQACRWQYRAASGLHRIAPRPADGSEPPLDPGLIARLWTANQLQGLLATDGRLVFAIDQLEYRWTNGSPPGGAEIDAIAAARQTNALVAIETQGPTAGLPRWTVGGLTSGNEKPSPLAGYFFCGPPLPVEGRLYAIAEHRQEILLVCLEADSGRLCWEQSLCLTPVPIAHDLQRYQLAAVPVLAEGLIVCPTHCGVLVAVDPETRSLRWGCSHDDADQLERLATWPLGSRRRYEHTAVVNAPLVAGGRLVYLPPQSQNVLCVDLASGQIVWTVPRDEIDSSVEYVAAADRESVLVVGRRRCRGVSLSDGGEIWTRTLASTPSGRGVRLGGHYVLPASDGQLVCLEIATGDRIGLTRANPNLRPGNLLVSGDAIVSVGTSHVFALPQASAALRQLAHAERSPVLTAELKLALGDVGGARSLLKQFLDSPGETPPDEAQSLLREILLAADLEDTPEGEESLRLLERYSPQPADRGQFLVRRATLRAMQGRVPELLADLGEIVDLPLEQPLSIGGEFGRTASPEAWVRSQLAKLQTRAEVASFVETRLSEARRSGELSRLRRWARACADFPQVWPVRLEIARKQIQAGLVHEPEMDLILCRRSADPGTRQAATLVLADLLASHGLPHESAKLIVEAQPRPDGGPLPKGVRPLEPDSLTSQALRRLSPPSWLVNSEGPRPKVTIRQEAGVGQPSPQGAPQGKPRQTPRNSPYQLFDFEQGTTSELSLVDRTHGGLLPGTIKVPARAHYPIPVESAMVGEMLPLGSQGTAHGVSLLEHRMVWSTAPQGLHPVNDIVRIGPAGPDFVVCQCWHHLFVLDPADGRVLWHRQDLSGNSGLMSDPLGGILADEKVLAVFDFDRSHYTLYDLVSGGALRRGKIDIDLRQTRRPYGRRLFHHTRSAENRRVRVWDVASDATVWEEPIDRIQDSAPQAGFRGPGAKLVTFVADSNEIAYVTVEGRLRIVDALTGEVRLDAEVEAEDPTQIGALGVFKDEQHYYVNLRQWPPQSGQNSYLATDTLVVASHVQGDLYAYSRKSQRVVWQRDLGNRTVALLPDYHLPLMVTYCRLRNSTQMTLLVEILSTQDGQPLATREDLLSDQVHLMLYRRDPAQIVLKGSKADVLIDLPAPRPALQTAAGEGPQTR